MGHKSLLKAALSRTTEIMELKSSDIKSLKSQAVYVHSLAVHFRRASENYDKSVMDNFLNVMKEITDSSIELLVSTDASQMDVRDLLEGAITLLLSLMQQTRPESFNKLNAINWRKLFNMEVKPEVQVIVAPPSDEDSGGSSLGDERSAT